MSRLKYFFAAIIFVSVSVFAQTETARESIFDQYSFINVSPNEITALLISGNNIV